MGSGDSGPDTASQVIRAATPLVGIICLTIMSVSALEAGINGTVFSATIGAICLLVGYRGSDILQVLRRN